MPSDGPGAAGKASRMASACSVSKILWDGTSPRLGGGDGHTRTQSVGAPWPRANTHLGHPMRFVVHVPVLVANGTIRYVQGCHGAAR